MSTTILIGDTVPDENAWSTISKIVVDDDGSVYAVGYFYHQVSFAGNLLTGPVTDGVLNGFVVAYDPSMVFKWIIHLHNDLGSAVYGLDLFSSTSMDKRIAISGYYKGEDVDFPGNGMYLTTTGIPLTLPTTTIKNGFVAYIDSNGLAVKLNGISMDMSDPTLDVFAFRCVVDKSEDNVIVAVAGQFGNLGSPVTVDFTNGFTLSRPANTPGKDAYLAFYDLNGLTFNVKPLNTSANSEATITDLIVDGIYIYCTGGWFDTMMPGPTLSTNATDSKLFVLRYDKTIQELDSFVVADDGINTDNSMGGGILSRFGQIGVALGYEGDFSLGMPTLPTAPTMSSWTAVATFDAALTPSDAVTVSMASYAFPSSLGVSFDDPSGSYLVGGSQNDVPRVGFDTGVPTTGLGASQLAIQVNGFPLGGGIDQSSPAAPETWIASTYYNDVTGVAALSGNLTNVAYAEIRIPIQPCLKAGTKVSTFNQETNQFGETEIENLKPGNFLIDYCGNLVELTRNVELKFASTDFVFCPQGSLGNDSDLYIRAGHCVLYKGREVPCEALIDQNGIRMCKLAKPVKIFTLCTEKRTFVMMQNVAVATWSEKEWSQKFD